MVETVKLLTLIILIIFPPGTVAPALNFIHSARGSLGPPHILDEKSISTFLKYPAAPRTISSIAYPPFDGEALKNGRCLHVLPGLVPTRSSSSPPDFLRSCQTRACQKMKSELTTYQSIPCSGPYYNILGSCPNNTHTYLKIPTR